jgi:hypothetical protein
VKTIANVFEPPLAKPVTMMNPFTGEAKVKLKDKPSNLKGFYRRNKPETAVVDLSRLA